MQMHIHSDSGVPVTDLGKGVSKGDASAQQQMQGQEKKQVDAPNVENSVTNLTKSLELMKETNFQVEYDRDIDHVIVKYRNTLGEVVRQVPTQDFVEFEKEFVKTIGLLFDKKV